MRRSCQPARLGRFRHSLIFAGLLALSLPAWGYVVFLKDGSKIDTKEKYRIEGDRAILILPSGTEAFYDASQIDVEKTQQANVINLSNATLIEGGRQTRLPANLRTGEEDLAFERFVSGRSLALPKVRRRDAEQQVTDKGHPTTDAGFVDLMTIPRKKYKNNDVIAEVLGYLKGQGVDRVRIFEGTEKDRPLLEIVAASEASVFKALEDSANSLVQIRERFAKEVAAYELVMMTESQDRAGQFLMTPETADLLASGRMKAQTFFLRYVEF
ncbi:MAG: hypothetical protein AAF657_21055 [Acidobacteriota bacterium]